MGPEIVLPMMIAGTLISAGGKVQQGNAAMDAATSQANDYLMQRQGSLMQAEASDYTARALRTQAGQERASSQRSAFDERRQARLAISRARAVAGASGAGADDPTALKIYGDLAGEGEYRALTRMYEGEDKARSLETSANLRKYEGDEYRLVGDRYSMAADASLRAGRNAKRAAGTSSLSTLISGGSSMFARYGFGGPAGTTRMPSTVDSYDWTL